MDLSISNFNQSVNARVLIGQIVSINTDTKTATIMLTSGSVADVPFHYLCSHGEDDHAATRVFRDEDVVEVLYTGVTAAPAADNLHIMGLVGELRTCRTGFSGFIVNLAAGAVTFNYITSGGYIQAIQLMGDKYLLHDNVPQGPDTVPPGAEIFRAGNQDWHGDYGTLSYKGPYSRYLGEPTDFSGYIYDRNNMIAVDRNVLGCAIAKIGTIKYYLAAFPVVYYDTTLGTSCVKFGIRRRLVSGSAVWTDLEATFGTITNGQTFSPAVFFSGNGRNCVATLINGQEVTCTLDANLTAFTATVSDPILSNSTTPYTIAMDYHGADVLRRMIVRTVTPVYGGGVFDINTKSFTTVNSTSVTDLGVIEGNLVNTIVTTITDNETPAFDYRESDRTIEYDDYKIMYEDLRYDVLCTYRHRMITRTVVTQYGYYDPETDSFDVRGQVSSVEDPYQHFYYKDGPTFAFAREDYIDPAEPDNNFNPIPLEVRKSGVEYLSKWAGVSGANHPLTGTLLSVIEDTANVHIYAPAGLQFTQTPFNTFTNLQFKDIGIIMDIL